MHHTADRKGAVCGDPVACIVATDPISPRCRRDDRRGLRATAPVPHVERALKPDARASTRACRANLVSHQTFTAGDPVRRFAQRRWWSKQASISTGRPTRQSKRVAARVWDPGAQHLTMYIGNQLYPSL